MKMLKITAAVVVALSLTVTEGMRLGDFIRGESESQCLAIGGTIVKLKSGQQICIKTGREEKRCMEVKLELMGEDINIPEEYCKE